MKLPISLGIKPALITAAVLLAVIAALLFNLRLANAAADTALANQGKAEAARDAAVTERDAWKSKAGDALAANQAYDHALGQLQEAAAEQRRLSQEAAKKAASAVAAAARDEEKALHELAQYRRIFGAKPKDCDAALLALDRVCKTLEGF